MRVETHQGILVKLAIQLLEGSKVVLGKEESDLARLWVLISPE